MRTSRHGARFALADPDALDPAELIPVFHRWIQRGALGGVLIDVADYHHVPGGPGVMLIGHEADRSLDDGPELIRGFLYQHKRDDEPPTAVDGVRRAIREALLLAREASADPGLGARARVRTDTFQVRVVDRLVAPPGHRNAFEALALAVGEVLDEAGLGAGARIALSDADPGGPLTVVVTLADGPGVDDFLAALAATPAAVSA